ncbi:protein ANTAGONIST OF LIKE HETEROCHROMATIN PROTEIN 1-like [Camponotus floridanus]|uniref:protein ANTAGONIST OF LIKE HETEROCHROMATIN PROTEIN 1-like n=1 Tax=Camponotus floridanus TaxID=104421 RepID=UPI000DC6AD71|nr:protein ANTAGONIST OF LIKE HETEROCHROMATIN PROTEIN 1-like [Camponotus floridanus]
MPESFDELLNLVEPIIRKQETNFRKPISSTIRLLITLRYLASGDLMSSLAMSYRLGKSTVSGIIQDTCQAIWEVLQHRVLFQSSQQGWKKIVDGFFRRWNFPHCIGAIDGKHVVIQAPPHAGSTFYNYKGQHSIVLIAVVSASYEFLMVDIGAQGRHNDGGIFKGSIMGQRFENKQMELPPPCPLSNCSISVPYMLVADAAFQLNEYTLRPYPGNRLNKTREIFNYRLSRARRVVENAFGIMTKENAAAIENIRSVGSNTLTISSRV